MQQRQRRFGIVLRLVHQQMIDALVLRGKAQTHLQIRLCHRVLPPCHAGLTVVAVGVAQLLWRALHHPAQQRVAAHLQHLLQLRPHRLKPLGHRHPAHEGQLPAIVLAREALFILLVQLFLPTGDARIQRGAHSGHALGRRQQRKLPRVHVPQLVAPDQQLIVQIYVGALGAELRKIVGIALELMQKFRAAFVSHRPRAQRHVLAQQPLQLAHGVLHLFVQNSLHGLVQRTGADVVLAQLGQHGGDVLGKRGAGRQNLNTAGVQQIPPAVHQKCRAMHGHAGLAGTGAADHGHDLPVLAADGCVLLGLNRGHNLAHMAGGRAGEDVQQHLVVDVELGVHIVLQLAVLHAILSLQRHLAHDFARRALIGHIARLRVVVQAADRRAPVVHQQIALFVGQAVQADDDPFQLVGALFHKVDPGKEGIHQHFPGALRHVLDELFPRGKAIHFGGELLHFLRRDGRGAQAKLLPCVGQDHPDGLRVAARQLLRLLDDGQQKPLHPLGIRPLRLKLVQLFHVAPPMRR